MVDKSSPRLSVLSSNRLLLPSPMDMCMCMPLPGRLLKGLGMKEQISPMSLAISDAAILKPMN